MNRRVVAAAAAAMMALTAPAVAHADTRSIDPDKLEQLVHGSSLPTLPNLGGLTRGGNLQDLAEALQNRGKDTQPQPAPAKAKNPESQLTDEQIAAQIVDYINDYRESQGVKRANKDDKLMADAQQWSKTMKVNQNLNHPDRISFRENVAFNRAGAHKAVDQWKTSAGHNTNLLADDVTSIGVGITRGHLSMADETGKVNDYGEGTFVVLRLR